ncbi:MAG: DUF2339 domain-containing protein [Candidatus Acidoferrales bacterium]|nr:DUF2339 domain-containing protein [Candidatus Acidoferrales bacterium]
MALLLARVDGARSDAEVGGIAMALLGVTVVKVFVFDLSFLTRFYRIVSFFVLGLVLLLVSFFYQRTRAETQAAKR